MAESIMDFKLRALMNARRKRRRLEQKAKKVKFHLIRANLEIRRGSIFGEEQVRVDGFMMLNDFGTESLTFFSNQRLEHREIVAINVDLGKKIFLRGKVAVCNEVPMSDKLFLQSVYRFRVQVKLVFQNERERQMVFKVADLVNAMVADSGQI